eukprot:UN13215
MVANDRPGRPLGLRSALFTNGFVDFLKDDNPSSPSDSIEPSKTSLFEIPSSSLNVEVKEND